MARKAAASRPARDLSTAAPTGVPWTPSPADIAPARDRHAVADPLDAAAAHLTRGEAVLAIEALLPTLDRRAAEGDRACELAAAALRLAPAQAGAGTDTGDMEAGDLKLAPDALQATMHRLVELLRRQEEQIRSLQDLVEELL